MKSVKTIILHKSKWDSTIFFNFVLTGAKGMFAYSMYKLLATIQFKKGKRKFLSGEKSMCAEKPANIEEINKYVKKEYASIKGVLPYK